MRPTPSATARPVGADALTAAKKAPSRRIDEEDIRPYVLSGELGKGSFAIVYKGYNEDTKEQVAIKTVVRSGLSSKLIDNLQSEIDILKSLSHRHITKLMDIVRAEKNIYLIMEYCSGGDLTNYIKKRGRVETLEYAPSPGSAPTYYPHPKTGGLDEVVVRSFLRQLARALKFLRERNLIHRDIKPQNLLLKPASQDELARGHPLGVPILKVADFGFARSLPNAMMAETLCGSPLYMAPEILRYEKYDAKADLWSVGAVLYETAVGRPPFRAQNHIELLKKIDRTKNIKFPDEDPATVEKDPSLKPVPSDIKKLIRSLLRQFPAERSSYDDFFKSTALAKSKFPRPPRDKDKERIASTSSLTKDPSTEMGDAETVVVGTISSNKRPSPTVLQVAKAVSDSPKPSATPSFKQPAEARVLTQARLSFRRPGQTPVVPLPDAIADAHSSDNSPVLGVMDPEQPEQLRRVPTEPARRRQLSTEASIIPGESEEDGLLRREYVMVGDNKTIEFGRTVDEIAAERRRQASDIAEEGPRLEEKSSNSHKSGHEQGQFTSKPVLNNIFPPPPNPLARPLSTSPSRGSALTRALNMASKKLFGTVSPGVHRVQSTYSYLTGFDKALNSRSQSTMRTPLLLKERSTSTGIRDPFEDDLLSELEELAQKTDVLTRWANEMYEYVKAAPKKPLPPLIAFTKLEGEDDDATERRRNAALDAEYNAVTCVALYLLLMAFSQKGIDKLRVHQEGMKMRDPEGTLEVSEGFDDALTWFSTHFMKCSDRIALVRSWLPESAMDGPTWLGQIVYDRALQLSRNAAHMELVNTGSSSASECAALYEESLWCLYALQDELLQAGNPYREEDKVTISIWIEKTKKRLASCRDKQSTPTTARWAVNDSPGHGSPPTFTASNRPSPSRVA